MVRTMMPGVTLRQHGWWLGIAICCGILPSLTASWATADQHVVVVLDDSGSMEEEMSTTRGRVERMQAAKEAIVGVLQQLPEDTHVAVLALNTTIEGSNWIVPLGTTSDRQQWQENIMSIRADGGTPLGASLRTAADALIELRNADVYGSYRLLVVTDGEANDPELVDAYLPQILSRGLELDVIGVDMQQEHSLATRAHSYRAASDNASLTQALTEVLAETSDDDASSAEDFELIAALPDGFAEAALSALNNNRREPLIDANSNEYAASPYSLNSSTQISGSSGVFDTFLGSCICCFGVIMCVSILLLIVVGSRKSRRGRRG